MPTLKKSGSSTQIGIKKNRTHARSKSAQTLVREIEEIATRLQETIKTQILKVAPEKGRHVIDFSVIINDGRIRAESPRISGASIAAKSADLQGFDPFEAGKKLVAEMQSAEGGAWTGADLDAHFGLTVATLHKRRHEHRIVWWKNARNQIHYPKWQFNPAGALLPGLQEILQTFQSQDEWRVMRYFLAPRHQLDDQRPLDLLRNGQTDEVISHAKAHAAENSW